MPDFKRILAVLDPTSKSQPALERAAWLAKSTGAALELFICDYDQYLAGERFFDESSLQQARANLIDGHVKRLRTLVKKLEKQDIDVSYDARWDHPLHEGIVRKVIDSKPCLVVKDTHFHPILKRSIFSNTDWNLIRTCPADLLLVKSRTVAPKPRIVAAVDPLHAHDKPAQLDHKILTAGRTLRDAVDGELHAFHAFDPAPAFAVSADSITMPLSTPVSELIESMKQEHASAMARLVEGYGLGSDAVHIHQGAATELLVMLAEQLQADFVVMGAVSRSGLQRLFVGSTAEQVLDRLPCDLLIVKPEGFMAEAD